MHLKVVIINSIQIILKIWLFYWYGNKVFIISSKYAKEGSRDKLVVIKFVMDNIQQIADAVQKGLQLVVRASVQQGSTRLTRLRNELYSDSFHAVLALSCGRVFQCCTATVVVYKKTDCVTGTNGLRTQLWPSPRASRFSLRPQSSGHPRGFWYHRCPP